MIRVILPYQLQTLAHCDMEVQLDVSHPVTQATVLEALHRRYPMLQGTIVDPHTNKRRPKIRFFACNSDVSHEPLDSLLPVQVASGQEPFLIVGAISGG